MKYCLQCGSANVIYATPDDDNRDRHVCQQCTYIHYLNPKVIAGCLLYWQGRVLLAKRSIEPRHGYWTIPAGFMELEETAAQAAARESYEEALAQPVEPTLYGVISLPRIGQVYLMYRGELQRGQYGVGVESQAVELFEEEHIPWNELAFPVVELTLRQFFKDCQRGMYPIFDTDITHPPAWKRAQNS